MKRQRGRNRRNHNNNSNRSLDSNGPDVKVRGTANQIYDKYVALARDAAASGNRVKAENYRQHAEHYLRLVNENESQKQAAREEAEAAKQEDADPVAAGEDGEAQSRGRRYPPQARRGNGADKPKADNAVKGTKERATKERSAKDGSKGAGSVSDMEMSDKTAAPQMDEVGSPSPAIAKSTARRRAPARKAAPVEAAPVDSEVAE